LRVGVFARREISRDLFELLEREVVRAKQLAKGVVDPDPLNSHDGQRRDHERSDKGAAVCRRATETGSDQRRRRHAQHEVKSCAPLRTEASPFKARVKDEAVTTWVKPKLLEEVKFAEWTKAGEMRQPAHLGLREDKRAEDVVEEREVHR
jgi:hypothetical protein